MANAKNPECFACNAAGLGRSLGRSRRRLPLRLCEERQAQAEAVALAQRLPGTSGK